MLQLEGVSASYGAVRVLRDVALTAEAGRVTCIMGRNGVGKTTLMRAIMALVARQGRFVLNGADLSDLPAHEVPRHGIALVPQGRRLFGPLTVAENLEVGLLANRSSRAVRDRVLDLFPRLRDRLGQVSATLSGGEQQMLAIARALCIEPKVLLLDEPTEGLQPSMIAAIRQVVVDLKATGVATVLVEQRVEAVLQLADQVAFMGHGTVAEVVPAATLRADAPQFAAYVGV